ncbi:MAG: hypothetical protein AB7U63_09200 [Porticoccaceae bacterium]|jgi:4-hydroxy-tetrahydrodipicolinate reductase
MTQTHPPLRIVIYGTGQYGCYITRLALQKGWSIVAAFNRAGDKVGQDLGLLAGLDNKLGVIVEDCDTASFDNLEADIGIVTLTNQLSVNFIAHERLLKAGMNVLCHGSESYYPYGCDPVIAEQIDNLAKQNNVTFSGGGIWDMSRIWSGILLLGPCTGIRSIFHSGITDVHGQAATIERAEEVGIGLSVDEYMARGLNNAPLANSYKTIPEHVLAAVGYTISSTSVEIEPVVYDEAMPNPWTGGTIAAGVCIGTRIIGKIDTLEGVTATVEIELRVFKKDEVEHVFWSVDGEPRNEIRINRKDTAHTTAGSLFNRIPNVVAAKPGIVLISQMGPLTTSAI